MKQLINNTVLTPEQLNRKTDNAFFDFVSSEELIPADATAGQPRAVSVIRKAVSMPGLGYHLIAVGKEGTSRLECIYTVVRELNDENSINVDRVLLPHRSNATHFEEISLKPGGAQFLLAGCQRVISARLNGNQKRSSEELSLLQEKFSDRPLLSQYLHWLSDVSSSVAAELQQESGRSSSSRAELVNMLPVVLHFGRAQGKVCLMDPLPDAVSLLGSVSVDPESGRVMIKAGTLIQASDGVLIIDARKLMANKANWLLLREVLKTGLIPLSAISSAQSTASSRSVVLSGVARISCQVILLCDSASMDALNDADADLGNVFSVVAEFESELERNDENSQILASIIASQIKKYDCLPLRSQAMASMIDLSARMTDCQHKLSLNRAGLSNTLREANQLAMQEQEEMISHLHVRQALDDFHDSIESDRRDALQAIIVGETRVELSGKVIGQINGLTMVGSGAQSYLEPSRITATVRAGDGTVVDIEREVSLGGSIHSKGVMILSSLLAARYSRHSPLSLIATLVFEQSYSDVDGDSASAAEMIAILSSIAEVPVNQALAITGSIDQRGQILCVGDVNNKVEGYYKLVKQHGNMPGAGVIIPQGNLRDLMLNDEVVDAVKDGSFVIHAVSDIDQLIEILTDMPAGIENAEHEFKPDCFNGKVQEALKQFAEEKKEEGRPDHHDDT